MEEHISSSGKYKLIINDKETKPGCWNYTIGSVYRSDNKLIAEIERNYQSFPFLFIENHKNGHDFLICGADYQGQTVIELDTEKRRDYLPPEAKDGFGFCWSSYRFYEQYNILVVCGCFWACPYEFRFYDFSDPINNGWKELEIIDPVNGLSCIDDDMRWPEFQDDGTIKCFATHYDDDDEDETKKELASIITLKRNGDKLDIIDTWLSENEKIRRQKQEEAQRKYEEWEKNFKEKDPLFLEYRKLVKDSIFSPEKYESHGITHLGWWPDKDCDKQEKRWCRRIHDSIRNAQKRKIGYTIDLEWGVETGPVKLIIYKDGNSYKTKFFEHSIIGMNQAFDYAKSLITKKPWYKFWK